MPVLGIQLLGDFRLTYGDQPLTTVNTARLHALLAYLVLHRNTPQPRKHLAFLFWPDTGEAQALTNLRNLLHKLRQALPDPDRFFGADTQAVYWRPEASYALDVAEFESLAGSVGRAHLERAAELYQGELLPSCYDDWIVPERERLQQTAAQALARLIEALEVEDDCRGAIGYGRRLRQLDPLNEEAHRTIMRLHAANQDRAGVLRAYHTCVKTLQEEFGTDPAPETRDLYERLLQNAAAPPLPSGAAQSQPRLVGRRHEWEALQAAWRAAGGGKPGCVLVTGEAGIGKTRLAEEMVIWAGRQGATVAVARCNAAEGALAYGPVVAWLRTPALRPRLAALEPVWATEVARLLPDLLAARSDLARPRPARAANQRQRLFEALARTVLEHGKPLLLLIDDLQWCDRDTLEWLHFLLRFDPRARLLLLGAVRAEDAADNPPLAVLLAALRRDGQLTELELAPLSADEATSLAVYLSEQALTQEQLTGLYRETEGNPLFLVETIRSGLAVADQSSRPSLTGTARPLPPRVHSVLHARLAQLSAPARELAGLAAAIGREFTLPVLAQASDQDEAGLVRSLDELWQRRIVADASSQRSEAYDFTHDKLREVAYNSLSAARRRLLHRRIGEALEIVHAPALDAVSGQAAAHYELAGRFEQAVLSYKRAAEVARRVYANADAIRDYRHAIALLVSAEPAPELATALHEGLGDVLHLTSQHTEARAAYRQALASLLPTDRFGPARLQCKIGTTLVSEHDLALAEATYSDAQATLGPEPALSAAEWWREWLQIQQERILLGYWLHQPEKIETLVAEARPSVEQYGAHAQRAQFFRSLLLAELIRQRWRVTEEMSGYARKYLAAEQQAGSPGGLAWAVFMDGFCWCLYGDLDQAANQLQAALAMTERIGDISLQARCLTYLTVILRQRGQVAETQQSAPLSLKTTTAAYMPEYMAMATANQAWAAWCAGDLMQTQALGRAALALWDQLPLGRCSAPSLWPLIAVALHDNYLSLAVEHGRVLLEPSQQRLPDALAASLEQAILAWEAGAPETAQVLLHQSMGPTQRMHYL